MSNLKGTKTHENLKHAFAGESQANRRYLYFARVADIEGYPEIGGLFRDTWLDSRTTSRHSPVPRRQGPQASVLRGRGRTGHGRPSGGRLVSTGGGTEPGTDDDNGQGRAHHRIVEKVFDLRP